MWGGVGGLDTTCLQHVDTKKNGYGILLLAYECFYLHAPQYLIDLLQIYTPDKNLRSKGKDLFVIQIGIENLMEKEHLFLMPLYYGIICPRV